MNNQLSFEAVRLEGMPQQIQLELEKIMGELASKVKPKMVALADISGRIVTLEGEIKKVEPGVLTAVSAGFFAALSEVGKMIGEPRFSFNQHFEGLRFKMYLTYVSSSFFLIMIYEGRSRQGIVRVHCDHAIRKMREVLEHYGSTNVEGEASKIFDDEFVAQLEDILVDVLQIPDGN